MDLHRTDRFVIREFRLDDAEAFAAGRNDASTAEFQSWSTPYPFERDEQRIREKMAMEGLVDGQWFGYAIAHPETDEVIGDVGFRSEWDGRSVELGYNLSPQARGQGIASDAAGWLIDSMFSELGVLRFHAALHPDNVASMMVLERLGFIYEGTARRAHWVDDVCTDDPRFGLLPSDRQAWKARPRNAPSTVELVEITPTNRATVFGLQTHRSQERFVAPMAKSAIDGLVPGPDDGGGTLVPWMRAVVADGEVVGFVMVAAPTPTNPYPFLWRLLIDRMHQRRGIGTKVLDLLVDHYRTAGTEKLLVSWEAGKGSPAPLYLAFGFVVTGQEEDGEVVASLPIREPL